MIYKMLFMDFYLITVSILMQLDTKKQNRTPKYDLFGISETWWESSYNWNTTMERYKLFRKAR